MSSFYKRKFDDIVLTDAGTYTTVPFLVTSFDKVYLQCDTIKKGSGAATVYVDIRAHEFATWKTLDVSGSPLSLAVAAATGVIDSTGKLTFTSVSTVSAGNEIKVILVDGETAGSETVTVTTSTTKIDNIKDSSGVFYDSVVITVGIEAGVSTAEQVKDALNNDAAAAAFISTVVTTAAAMGEGEVYLTGGSLSFDVESASYQVRMRVVCTTGAAGFKLRPFVSAKT
jgi:hypothetical protein